MVNSCGHACFIVGGPFISEDPDCPEHGITFKTELALRRRDPDRLSDDDIIKTYDEAEACRHKTRFWCEDCQSETHLLTAAYSKQHAFEKVVAELKLQAGAAWVEGKHDVAAKLKLLAEKFAEDAKDAENEANIQRRKQGIK